MQARFKFFSERFIYRALTRHSAHILERSRNDSHIKMCFTARRSARMTGMARAIIDHIQFN